VIVGLISPTFKIGNYHENQYRSEEGRVVGLGNPGHLLFAQQQNPTSQSALVVKWASQRVTQRHTENEERAKQCTYSVT